ncbi:MAG: PKD domain-containing protein [Marinifilaceae bacterium]
MKGKLILLIMSIVLLTSCSKDNGEEKLQAKVDFSYVIDLATKTVTFTNKSVAVGDYNWFFAEGETSREKSPKHTFKSEGTFKVLLTARDTDSPEVLFKKETIVIGDPNGHKPMAAVQEAEDIEFAGFKIKWTRTNPQTRATLKLQISDDANFEHIVKTQRIDNYDNQELNANDLNVTTQYWFRIQITYRESTEDEIYYSEVKTATTTDMPSPSFTVKNSTNGSFCWFEVIKNSISSKYIFSEHISRTFEISRSETFEAGYEAMSPNVFNTYIKEPNTKYYIRYSAVYKGTTRTAEGSKLYSYKYIANLGNGNGLTGDHSRMFKKNGKTMLEFGVKDGARSIIQINGFTGVGKYPLKFNDNHFKEAANTINTVDDSYAYYFDGTSAFKYFLSRQGIYLNVYRETATAYYCTIISDDHYDSLQFRQSRLEVKNGNYYHLHTPYFVVMK